MFWDHNRMMEFVVATEIDNDLLQVICVAPQRLFVVLFLVV